MAMAPSGQLTAPALQALLQDGTLAGDWTLDPARSEVHLHTRHTWGLLPLHGRFEQVSGSGTVTAEGQASGVLTVPAVSVNTKNSQRDKHLRSPDFFDVANHPDITFTVDSITPADRGARVSGQLTIRDRTRPASFDATVAVADDEITLDGELAVDRTDFGLTWNFLGIAAKDSTIAVHATFTR
jgi:polyisoprenoid-binding protein YceI